ncbi:hypothetical protein Dimus_015540 [Dionaea muscipula]
MVGRRDPSQRRVVEDRVDSWSPGPRHPVMFRGSPSPPTTFHHRPAPSPRPRTRHLRSPSPVLRSSVDQDDFSSSEAGEGDSTEKAVTSEEEDEAGIVSILPVELDLGGLWQERGLDDGGTLKLLNHFANDGDSYLPGCHC